MNKFIIALCLVSLTNSVYALCDWQDFDCKERERRQGQVEREIEYERRQRDIERLEYERERFEREREQAVQDNLRHRCSGRYASGTSDRDYACNQ